MVESALVHDLVRLHTGLPREPTCRGSRAIDHAFCNGQGLHLVRLAAISPHSWPADHKCIQLQVQIVAGECKLDALKLPKPLPAACAKAAANEIFEDTPEDVVAPCLAMKADCAYEQWSERWESILLRRAQAQGVEVLDGCIGRSSSGITTRTLRFKASKEDGKAYDLQITDLEHARAELTSIKR
eukprot:799520-Amphidinium_carterae.1